MKNNYKNTILSFVSLAAMMFGALYGFYKINEYEEKMAYVKLYLLTPKGPETVLQYRIKGWDKDENTSKALGLCIKDAAFYKEKFPKEDYYCRLM